MRVWHINCGTLRPPGGRLVSGVGGLFSRATLVCHCLLIETAEHGLVLVDTGFSEADVQSRGGRRRRLKLLGAQLRPHETAASHIKRLGFSLEDVQHIVLTHLDIDHAGGLSDFPRAQVHVLADEHDAAMTPKTFTERQRYAPHTWEHHPRWVLHRTEGERWEGFECVRRIQDLPPEVLLIPLAGHTRGHCAVAVDAEDGWLVHGGDAYFHAAEMNPHQPWCPKGLAAFQAMMAEDNGKRLQNQGRLRDLIRDRGDAIRVFSAHDPSELQRYG